MNYAGTINVGDILMRPKSPGIDHVGIVVGHNLVCENTPDKGEHLSTVSEFATGSPIKVRHTGANPVEVIARAKRVLANPKRYDPVHRNCEHTVFEILYGVAKSPVVLGIVCLAVIGGILLLLLRR